MREAVVVSAVRTPVGKAPRGALRFTRPDDLGAIAVRGALDRVPQLDAREIDDVIIGCAMPEAEQGMNVARVIAFRAGLPVESAAMTINRYCASGLQAIALAAERIRGGGADVIVAGGAESMSFVPMGGNKIAVNPWLVENYPGSYLTMGLTAERVGKHYNISREDADQFSLASHQKAMAAIEAGKFDAEIVPVPVTISSLNGGSRPKTTTTEFLVDEGPRIKRFMPRAQGRADQRLTRTSHISLSLAERTGAPAKKVAAGKTKTATKTTKKSAQAAKSSGDK